jgi:hypothetical protein
VFRLVKLAPAGVPLTGEGVTAAAVSRSDADINLRNFSGVDRAYRATVDANVIQCKWNWG